MQFRGPFREIPVIPCDVAMTLKSRQLKAEDALEAKLNGPLYYLNGMDGKILVMNCKNMVKL